MKFPHRMFAVSCCLAWWPAGARAAADISDTAASLLQMLIGLAIVLALLGATLWAIRRLQGARAGAGMLRVVSACAVGARERVVVVEVEHERLVLGVAPGSVRLLATLPEKTAAPSENSFAARLAERTEQRP
ncbi:MAG: flagellar biosynthetic protein FliO [Rhodocyclaceae bacterium]|nr:flagellar biosynthetic protein FliO [Rhodocyclaceae bacterium]MBX3668647.1 flagellar biosynthetic protein FliO [Rhodocyclaceae bacterium]